MNPIFNHLFRFVLAGVILTASASAFAQSPDELANAAREAARTNRNVQSADLFERPKQSSTRTGLPFDAVLSDHAVEGELHW